VSWSVDLFHISVARVCFDLHYDLGPEFPAGSRIIVELLVAPH
jgi:hypothetical protein